MNEHVCNFGADRGLAGIATDANPQYKDENLPTVILLNAGLLHHVGQNRLNVVLARRIADIGFPAFRFDFSGLGDSAIQKNTMPVRERNVREVSEAIDFLESTRGAREFILVGLCTGADNAHRAAVEDTRVKGVVMLDGYSYVTNEYVVRRFRNKVFSPSHWKNFLVHNLSKKISGMRKLEREAVEARSFFWVLPKKSQVIKELNGLVARKVSQLQIFSGSNIGYNYREQYRDALSEVDFGDLLHVVHAADADHTFSMTRTRDELIAEILNWLNTRVRTASCPQEVACQFGTNPRLTGILSIPEFPQVATRKTGILILSSGLLHRAGPFRLHVDLARNLATSGFRVLRIDQAGRGDSTRGTGLTASETIREELRAASEYMKTSQGIEKVVLIGLCSGADDAVNLAVDSENVAGLVLLDGYAKETPRYYLQYYLTRLVDLNRVYRFIVRHLSELRKSGWRNSGSEDDESGQLDGIRDFPDDQTAKLAVRNLMDRGGSMLSVFTGDVEAYYCYDGQFGKAMNARPFGDAFQEIFYKEARHTYSIRIHRQRLIRAVSDWCWNRVS